MSQAPFHGKPRVGFRLVLWVGFLVPLFLSEPALAETTKEFQLTDGSVVLGVVVDEGDSGYLIRDQDGRMIRVAYEDVQSVKRLKNDSFSGSEASSDESSSNCVETEENSAESSAAQEVNLLGTSQGNNSINLLNRSGSEEAAEGEESLPSTSLPLSDPPPRESSPTVPLPSSDDETEPRGNNESGSEDPTVSNKRLSSLAFHSGGFFIWALEPPQIYAFGTVERKLASGRFAVSFGGQLTGGKILHSTASWFSHPDLDHHFEASAALWYDLEDPQLLIVPYTGYRFQKPAGGLVVRLGTTLLVVPTASVGWSL